MERRGRGPSINLFRRVLTIPRHFSLITAWRSLTTEQYCYPISGIGGPHQGVYLCRSTDAGESWSEPELVGDGIANFDWSDVHTYGKIRELSDGTLLMPVWGRLRGERVAASAQLRSIDGGRTWDEGVVLCRGVIAQNELIELPDGRLMAIVASDDSPRGTA